MMKNTLLTISLTLAATGAFAQTSEVRRLFESGQYQAVVESASPDGDPGNLYAAAQSHQKLGAIDNAMAAYAALASRGEEDPWHWIGQSGQQILQDDAGGAIAS